MCLIMSTPSFIYVVLRRWLSHLRCECCSAPFMRSFFSFTIPCSCSLYIAVLLHSAHTNKQTCAATFSASSFSSFVFHIMLHVLFVLYVLCICRHRRCCCCRRHSRRPYDVTTVFSDTRIRAIQFLFKSRAWFNKFNHSATFSIVYNRLSENPHFSVYSVCNGNGYKCNVRHVYDLPKWQKPEASVSALHAWSYLLLRKWVCVQYISLFLLFGCSIVRMAWYWQFKYLTQPVHTSSIARSKEEKRQKCPTWM